MKSTIIPTIALLATFLAVQETQAALPSDWCKNENGDAISPDGVVPPTLDNYCNSCGCNEGAILCTLMACAPCPNTSCDKVDCAPGKMCVLEARSNQNGVAKCPKPKCKKMCKHGGKSVKAGYSLPGLRKGWCNTCTCDADGSGEMTCTNKSCPPRFEGCAVASCMPPPLNCKRLSTGYRKDGCPKKLCDLKCKPKLDKGCSYDSCNECDEFSTCVKDPFVQCIKEPCCATMCQPCPIYDVLPLPPHCKYVGGKDEAGCPMPVAECDCPKKPCQGSPCGTDATCIVGSDPTGYCDEMKTCVAGQVDDPISNTICDGKPPGQCKKTVGCTVKKMFYTNPNGVESKEFKCVPVEV